MIIVLFRGLAVEVGHFELSRVSVVHVTDFLKEMCPLIDSTKATSFAMLSTLILTNGKA